MSGGIKTIRAWGAADATRIRSVGSLIAVVLLTTFGVLAWPTDGAVAPSSAAPASQPVVSEPVVSEPVVSEPVVIDSLGSDSARTGSAGTVMAGWSGDGATRSATLATQSLVSVAESALSGLPFIWVAFPVMLLGIAIATGAVFWTRRDHDAPRRRVFPAN